MSEFPFERIPSGHIPFERIGEEKGEWFERYVEAIFKFGGFVTERDRLFQRAVKHEIDIFAEADFGSIAVECKDWRYMAIGDLKKELDAFATKVRQIGATTGVFALNTPDDHGRFDRYREYMRSEGLTLWDAHDIEHWYNRIDRHKDKISYQKELCDSLGVQIRPKTKTEKTFGFLKAATKLSVKAASAGIKTIDAMSAQPKKKRRHRKSRPRS